MNEMMATKFERFVELKPIYTPQQAAKICSRVCVEKGGFWTNNDWRRIDAQTALVIHFGNNHAFDKWLLSGHIKKRDVTVVNRNPTDPCPTIVDSNRQVGANLVFGPRLTGSFFGQGQSQNPANGFKSWGGALGAPELGLMRGFNLGIPIGSKKFSASLFKGLLQPCVLPTDCVPNNNNVGVSQVGSGGNLQPMPQQPPQQQPGMLQSPVVQQQPQAPQIANVVSQQPMSQWGPSYPTGSQWGMPFGSSFIGK
uniref:Uncharacterized protein n=1 Tax=Romanomermis culicivorax TaxID=13658 RepID=A0A915J7P1_ROMCU